MTCPDHEWQGILEEYQAKLSTPLDADGVVETEYEDINDLDKRMYAKYVLKEEKG